MCDQEYTGGQRDHHAIQLRLSQVVCVLFLLHVSLPSRRAYCNSSNEFVDKFEIKEILLLFLLDFTVSPHYLVKLEAT